MAEECDDRAHEAEYSIEGPRKESGPTALSQPKEAVEPLTVSIKDASRLLGLGRTTIYRLISDRELETVKVGNRTLIKAASIRSLVEVHD
jgi:excisionase family DNA binding protein